MKTILILTTCLLRVLVASDSLGKEIARSAAASYASASVPSEVLAYEFIDVQIEGLTVRAGFSRDRKENFKAAIVDSGFLSKALEDMAGIITEYCVPRFMALDLRGLSPHADFGFLKGFPDLEYLEFPIMLRNFKGLDIARQCCKSLKKVAIGYTNIGHGMGKIKELINSLTSLEEFSITVRRLSNSGHQKAMIDSLRSEFRNNWDCREEKISLGPIKLSFRKTPAFPMVGGKSESNSSGG